MNHRTRGLRLAATLTMAALAVSACGRSVNDAHKDNISATSGLVNTTPPGKTPVSSITWATYRDVNSLDSIFAFDYPENTAISLVCESLLRVSPDGAVGPGLAEVSTPDPTTLVFSVRTGAKFWDGNPVTAADVVYSLHRQTDPKLGGFYANVFERVKSIEETGPAQVTMKLKQPDYWLETELSSMPGVIVEKSYVEKQGKNYGTASGGVMCTGAYQYKSWTPGKGLIAVAAPHYWGSTTAPLVKQITVKGYADVSALTSGLLTGGIQGAYTFAMSTLGQLKNSSTVKVYQGQGWSQDALVVSDFKGPLGNPQVRKALSLALDRKGIIDSVYKGAALMPRWLSNPGSFGYARPVFDQAYQAAPEMTQDIAQAKQLIAKAGATGQTIRIGMTPQLANNAAEAGAYQAAGKAIGLNVTFKAVSADAYINFFTDPAARKDVDGYMTVSYPDGADPAGWLAAVVEPKGSLNYGGFDNAKITSTLEKARGTADPTERARLVVQAEQLVAEQLPWIPNVEPTSVLLLNKGLSGAVASFAYMDVPWANQLGGVS